MPQRDIVVMGGSAGSVEPIRTIMSSLPTDFPASVFVVIHSADAPSMLADVLSRAGPLPAGAPNDNETFQPGHIYLARPDFHLMLEANRVRVLRGARENRHRPAIDALFRSAAREHGPRVVGIILSGLFDDGSAGLYAIRQRGGVAIIQDPRDAVWSEMPQRALEYASPQHVLRTPEIAPSLIRLVNSGQGEIAMAAKKTIAHKSNHRSNRKHPQNTRSAAERGTGKQY